MSWFKKLKEGLQRSSEKLTTGIVDIVTKRKLDDDVLEELEELLIQADLGLPMAARVTEHLSKTRFNQEVSDIEIKQVLADKVSEVLQRKAGNLELVNTKPHVILVVGVNGSGKTTTIAKLGKYWQEQGKQVRMVAGDTFRAAAVEQLQAWGRTLDIPVECGAQNSDAASLAYSSYEKAISLGDDVLIIDTAGRLHNKSNLMDELEKIVRVIKKLDDSAPHSCLLVLDATTGQNAHAQVKAFGEIAKINGIIMTKLDGTAKGGVLVSLAESYPYPIYAIGVGEGIDDLRPFQADEFAKQLVGLS